MNRFTVITRTPKAGSILTIKNIKAETKQEACDKAAKINGGFHGTLSVKKTS